MAWGMAGGRGVHGRDGRNGPLPRWRFAGGGIAAPSLAWSTPAVFAANGASGTTGNTGNNGVSTYTVTAYTLGNAQPLTPLTNTGSSQTAILVLAKQTTDATATILTSDLGAATTTNQVILPNNSAYYVRGSIIAGVTGAGNTSSWTFQGTIKRGANAASTALVGAMTATLVTQDAGASTWAVSLTADTTNGGLAVTVTGQAATTIRWVCKIETTEMTY